MEGSKGYHLFSNHKLIGNIELGVRNVDITNGYKILVQGKGNLRLFVKNRVELLYNHDGMKIIVCDHFKRISHNTISVGSSIYISNQRSGRIKRLPLI